MKKNLTLVIMLVCFGSTTVFAAGDADYEADDLLNLPGSVEPGNITASVGIGLLGSLVLSKYGTSLVPPLSLNVEYVLPINIPLSVGATIGFASNKQTSGIGNQEYTYTWPVFSVGAKAAYHFDWELRGLDTYAALTLGANFMGANTEYSEDAYGDSPKPSAGDAKTFFLFGLEFGIRFFFTSNFGVFIEEGFNTFSYLRSGFVLKF